MCGEELLTEAQRQAALDAIEARLAEILSGDRERDWAPLGYIPEAFRPPVFKASYTPACRICAASGHSACPLHGPFRPLLPEIRLSDLRVIGGS